METKKCVYCGEYAPTKDHIIPVIYYYNGERKGRHLTAEYGKENLVDCCRECNSLGSDIVFDTFDEKRDYIQDKITKKYKKIIDSPFWEEEEIKEMGYSMRKEIRIQQLARNWILNRINYPEYIYPPQQLNKDIMTFLNKHF